MFGNNTARNDKFNRPIIDSNRTGPCSAAPLSVQSSYRYENILRIGEVLGHRIDAKISPKAASEKAQTTVSENRCTSPKIDVFRTAILTLLAPTGNNARASFLVHQVPRTSATVSPNVYAVFPPRLSVRLYLSSDNFYCQSEEHGTMIGCDNEK